MKRLIKITKGLVDKLDVEVNFAEEKALYEKIYSIIKGNQY